MKSFTGTALVVELILVLAGVPGCDVVSPIPSVDTAQSREALVILDHDQARSSMRGSEELPLGLAPRRRPAGRVDLERRAGIWVWSSRIPRPHRKLGSAPHPEDSALWHGMTVPADRTPRAAGCRCRVDRFTPPSTPICSTSPLT